MIFLRIYNNKGFFILLPFVGILLFVFLYGLATFYYPGGSNFDRTTTGFDWQHNYWCDLTTEQAKNGEQNSARAIALTAMLILCASLAMFWFYVPQLFTTNKFNWIIRYAGITSQIIVLFLFTPFHDTVITVAGLLGMAALTGVFVGLYKNGLIKLFSYGVFCLGLMLFNYFIYQTSILLSILPVIQKITFVLFLSWICLIDLYLYKTIKT